MSGSSILIEVCEKWHFICRWVLEYGETKTIVTGGLRDSCVTGLPTGKVSITATKILNVELEESSIALFPSRDNITVDDIVTTTSPEYSLSSPQSFEVFSSTGIKDYALYAGVDFTGPSACLKVYHSDATEGYGVTTAMERTIVVGSVRVGCLGNEHIVLNWEHITNLFLLVNLCQ